MLNVEKYKDELIHSFYCHLGNEEIVEDYDQDDDYNDSMLNALIEVYQNDTCDDSFSFEDIINWLSSEYREPILDDVERFYLSNIIKPFKDKIKYVVKGYTEQGGKRTYEWICFKGIDAKFDGRLPSFKVGTMYKGMESCKEYTLKELRI